MPISSAEIAQMAMMNYQQFNSLNSSFNRTDQVTGYAMHAGREAGSMGLASLSALPMGMAATAGMGAGVAAFGAAGGMAGGAAAFGAAGTAAALGAAPWAAAALPVMAGAAAAGYVGEKMWEGMGQQQQLNSTLARSFSFQNQQGRRGFSRGDTSQIGDNMRAMSHEMGPNGELTSMKELTEMAGKMGQTGMGKGVRDAQEFNQKFREMIKTVKSIATEMNTSLGQAMEFMQSSKSSGMFQQADQLKFARQVNQTAVGSGLATSEVAAMGNIGSQISRAYGGLGKSGAMGGMNAIGQIGGALQVGAISEEDIYNATGQSGAEGRQALATNMMSKTGEFLKSGKGRWFLASMADENGQIDNKVAQQYMSGSMGVGDTKGAAGSHLSATGRANFIRNEGRLRGAAMEKFGAMAPSIALMGWASQRGVDVNNMDDRSMLFAQRQLGMGRDEMDVAVKMAQDMPRIMQQQLRQQDSAKYGQSIGEDQKNRGVEGMKRRFEHAKEKINSKLEQAGSDMYNDLTNVVDRWLDNWMGTAIPAVTDNLSGIFRSTIGGGAQGKQRFESIFGGGKSQQRLEQSLAKTRGAAEGAASGAGGSLTSSRMSWKEFAGEEETTTGQWAMIAAGGGGLVAGAKLMSWATGQGETKKKLTTLGYDKEISEVRKLSGVDQQKALDSMITRAASMQEALSTRTGAIAMDSKLKNTMMEDYVTTIGSTGVNDRSDAVMKVLERESKAGNKDATNKLTIMQGLKRPEDRARFVSGMEEEMGLTGSGSLASKADKAGDLTSATRERMRGMTVTDRDRFVGEGINGGKKHMSLGGQVAAGAAIGAVIGSAALGAGTVGGAIVGGLIGGANYMFGGGKEEERNNEALGKMLRSEEAMTLTNDVSAGNEEAIFKAKKQTVQGKAEDASQEEKNQAVIARNALLTADIEKKGKNMADYTESERKDFLKRHVELGGSKEDTFDGVRGQINFQNTSRYERMEANRREQTRQLNSETGEEAKRLRDTGVLEKNFNDATGGSQWKLSGEIVEKLQKNGEKTQSGQTKSTAAALLHMEAINAGQSGDPEAMAKYASKIEKEQDMLKTMSLSELKTHVKDTGLGAVLYSDAKKFDAQSRRGGGALGVAAVLGIGGETKQQKRDLMQAWGKGEDAFIKEFSTQTGVGGLKDNQAFKDALKEAGVGGGKKGSSVQVAAALESAMKNDSGLAEKVKAAKESKASPADKTVTELQRLNATMKGLTPEAISASIATALTGAAPAIGAAMK